MRRCNDGEHNIRTSSLKNSVLIRLPGGMMLHFLNPLTWNFSYGPKVTCLCVLHHLGAFFAGDKNIRKRPVMRLKGQYPTLYHLSPKANVKSIMKNGLVSEQNRVWLTDWLDPCWQKKLTKHQMNEDIVCFRIDTKRLMALGHHVYVMNSFHEFTTDYVPPECLLSVKRMHGKRKN